MKKIITFNSEAQDYNKEFMDILQKFLGEDYFIIVRGTSLTSTPFIEVFEI